MQNNVYEEKMDKTISVLEENLSEIRAGRANPAILNKIRIQAARFAVRSFPALVSSAVTQEPIFCPSVI